MINTHFECPTSHEVKMGKGMHPKQNEQGSDSSGHTLTCYPWNYLIPLFTLSFNLVLDQCGLCKYLVAVQ